MSSKGRRRDATARAGECERCALMWDDHYMMPPVPVDDVKCASLTFRLGAGLSIVRRQDVHNFDDVRKHCGGQGYRHVLALEQAHSIDPTGLHVRIKDGLHVRSEDRPSSVPRVTPSQGYISGTSV